MPSSCIPIRKENGDCFEGYFSHSKSVRYLFRTKGFLLILLQNTRISSKDYEIFWELNAPLDSEGLDCPNWTKRLS